MNMKKLINRAKRLERCISDGMNQGVVMACIYPYSNKVPATGKTIFLKNTA